MSAAESWDSGPIAPGQSFSKTFVQPGTYSFHCNIHTLMKGTVQVVTGQVVAAVTPTPTPTPNPVNQLPRTGLPEDSYLLIGLIPMGFTAKQS